VPVWAGPVGLTQSVERRSTSKPAVPRRFTLVFDEFGWELLGAQAQEEAVALHELIERAAGYFESEITAGGRGTRLLNPEAPPGGRAEEVSLRLPARQWEGLEREAKRQQVPLARLLVHAAIYYCAAVDSGWTFERFRRRFPRRRSGQGQAGE
jgi:hypothetical protein